MAEAVGLVASGISIWQLVTTIKNLSDKIKCAPEKWKRYSENLESVYYVHTVITDIIKHMPSSHILTVNRGGQSQNLLQFSSENLMTVTQRADDLLQMYKFLNPNEAKTAKKQFKSFFNFRFMKEGVGFVLENDRIEDLTRGVEYAKSALELALSIALLTRTESRHHDIRNDIQQMNDKMVEHLEALKSLYETTKLNQRLIPILPSATSTNSAPKTPSRSPRLFRKDKNKRGSRWGGKVNQSKGSLGTAQASPDDDVAIASPTFGASSSKGSSSAEPTMTHNTELTMLGVERDKTPNSPLRTSPDDDNSGGNDSDDDDSRLLAPNTEDGVLDDRFDIVYIDRQLMIVDNNLGETIPQTGEVSLIRLGPQELTKGVRVSEVVESLSADEWERYAESDLEEFMDFLETATNSEDDSEHAETFSDFEIQPQIVGFIAEK
ncbi:hypothetical protein EG329_011733 [Mollisiaceae sp. DMI_Dod_QoI]|nr:hypothetical protein EG329_011733 [Helotiales sp. DMI_Dod_QoI]